MILRCTPIFFRLLSWLRFQFSRFIKQKYLELLHNGLVNIIDNQLLSIFQQVAGHMAAHVSETDEPDERHVSLQIPSILSRKNTYKALKIQSKT